MMGRGAAIVTGGASGIGEAMVLQLAARGFVPVIVDRSSERIADTISRVRAGGREGWGEVADVREEERIRQIVRRVHAEVGGIGYLVNAAGVAPHGAFASQGDDVRRGTFQTNLEGVLATVAAVFPHMAAARRGRIVTIASLAGLVPLPGMAAYSASKSALVSFMTAFRIEAARFGVGVTVACPGLVATRIRETTADVLGIALRLDPDPWFVRRLTPHRCAGQILAGAERNAPLVVIPWSARAMWRLYRLFPALYLELLASRLLPLSLGAISQEAGSLHPHPQGVEEEGGAAKPC